MTFDTTATTLTFRAGATSNRVGMKGAVLSTKHDEASTAAKRGAQRVARVESAGAFKLSIADFENSQFTAGDTL